MMTLQTDLVGAATRYLFFTGKGGVGKTSTACAAAVALADAGKRVLLVSTDPASNLASVLGTQLTREPKPIAGVPNLFALNIDPAQAAHAYRERVVGPYRGILPDESVAAIEEQLSGACTVEVAAFDEFTALLGGGGDECYDHVVFDTAPSGHTLRLLSLPAAWSGFLDDNPGGASCLGPASQLESQRGHYDATMKRLADATQTTLVLVTRPETDALDEAARTLEELAHQQMTNALLVVNGVPKAQSDDPLALALEEAAQRAIRDMPAPLAALPRLLLPLRPRNIVGLAALRDFFADESSAAPQTVPAHALPSGARPLSTLVDDVAKQGHGLVMVMGKGGVGKTTVATALAVDLATRGLDVHLTTTDPAAHIAATLHGQVPHLRISRIDPRAETEAYSKRVLAESAKELDADSLALLEEDLRSPCTEEVAVFHAFSRAVADAEHEVVVVDTAPTGHTLLLLDATGSYHREVIKKLGDDTSLTPMSRLRDPSFTRVFVVTLPETTPIEEASSLVTDLERAGIGCAGWIVNRSVSLAHTSDPLLRARAEAEAPLLADVAKRTHTLAILPQLAAAPVGPEKLLSLARPESSPAARAIASVARHTP